jgi:uncharacterized protein
MNIIEPHIHMVSRATDDYDRLFQAGVVAMTEPAFWAGFDRGGPEGFDTYFKQLTEWEPKRAAQHGIDHYCWICLNPKEAENLVLAREVLKIIPKYLESPRCLGVGEIGLNKNSRNELAIFEEHLEIAKKHKQMVLIHTPHLEDKLKGTKFIVAALKAHGMDPDRVIVDHCEEHTIGVVKEAGFWAGLTLYPVTKCTPERAIDILERWGTERVWMNSAADWGPSDPMAVPKAIQEMVLRGHPREMAEKVCFENPGKFLGQNKKFKVPR